MPEARIRQVMVNLESTFYEMMQEGITKRNKRSASTYLRDLLIADLIKLKLIDEDKLLEVLVGDSLS